MRTNHLLLQLTAAGVMIGSGAALVVACSSSSNPAPGTSTGEDGSASSSGSSSGATSSGTTSSSGTASSSGSSSGTASSSGTTSSSGASSSGSGSGSSSGPISCSTYDGGEGACNNCANAVTRSGAGPP